MRSLQAQALDFFEGEVAHACALAGFAFEYAAEVGAAADGTVVAEHQHRIFGHLKVELHNVGAHADDALDGGNGVLGEIAPVAPVASHDHILGMGIVDLRGNSLCTVGIFRCALGTANEAERYGKEDESFFHVYKYS